MIPEMLVTESKMKQKKESNRSEGTSAPLKTLTDCRNGSKYASAADTRSDLMGNYCNYYSLELDSRAPSTLTSRREVNATESLTMCEQFFSLVFL